MISFPVFHVHFFFFFFFFSGIGPSCFAKTLESVQNPIWAQLQPLGCYAHRFLHRLVNQWRSRLQLQSRLHQWTFKWEGLPRHGERCFKNWKAVWLTAKGSAYASVLTLVAHELQVWFNDFTARRFYLTWDMFFSWMMQTKPTCFFICMYIYAYIHMFVFLCIYRVWTPVHIYIYICMCIYVRIQTLPLQFLLCRQSWQFFVQRESMKDFLFSWKFVQDCCIEATSFAYRILECKYHTVLS